MGRQKKSVPNGHLRLLAPKNAQANKQYTIYYEYIWNSKPIRKSTDVKCSVRDWNTKGNLGRGELRPSFGDQYKHINATLTAKIDKTDASLLDYNMQHPNCITSETILAFLHDKPITRLDKGQDFVEFATERLKSKLSRRKIGESRYRNGISALNMLSECIGTYKLGTHKTNGIYLSEITPNLIDKYIEWKRNIKKNTDETINHSLSPILSACDDACKLGYINSNVNAQLQDMRIVVTPSLDDEEVFDEKFLTKEQLNEIVAQYKNCTEQRRKEYVEMFLFAFHACGLRMVDIMTLQWSSINFDKCELRKILVKTKNRHIIPLTTQALAILEKWHKKNGAKRFVFGLLEDNFDLNNEEELYRKRNTLNKCINQSIVVLGRNINLPFGLTMHVARHTFAVFALNDGMSMSMVSRLLGHASTDTTEKVYAKYLPETLAEEVLKLNYDFLPPLN